MSKLKDILNYIVAAQNSLELRVDNVLLPTVKRKLPKREETVDPAYQVTVYGEEAVDRIRRIAFESVYQVEYFVSITLITPNERDQLRNLDDHADWREATRAFYMKPNSVAVDGVKRVEIIRAPFLDRAQLNIGYDYNQIMLHLTTYERRQ